MSSNDLRAKVHSLMPQAKDDLTKLVAFKSVADAQQFPVSECLNAAHYVADAFSKAGIQDVRLLDMPYGHPAVYGYTPGPAGAPTVLLYAHYDVQPPMNENNAWQSPPFELTERGGRWYGRGAADCKGSIAAHLTALRAFNGEFPVGIKLIVEGSEEQSLGELEEFVAKNPELFRADALMIADTGNFSLGLPTLTTTLRGLAAVNIKVSTLVGPMHSGMFGGPAPDALAALIAMLATLHDADGNTTIRGLDNTGDWSGVEYPPAQFRADARVLDGVDLVGSGRVADMLWSRFSVSVLGIDAPSVAGAGNAVQATAGARVSLRVPPGADARAAQAALVAHLKAVTPWHVKLDIHEEEPGAPFAADTSGPAYAAMRAAMQEAYGRAPTTAGQGGSIPLTNVLHDLFPQAEIMLYGVEEPKCLIHAPNESVDPTELEHDALTEALFLQQFASVPHR